MTNKIKFWSAAGLLALTALLGGLAITNPMPPDPCTEFTCGG
jgi:hypothetical protein